VPERPRRPGLLFEELEEGSENDFVLERSHDGVAFTDPDLAGERLFDRSLVECTITGGRLDDATMRGSRFRETRFERCEATTLALDGAEMREVEFDSCRFGALEMYDVDARVVAFTGCRLGYVNLRGSEVVDLILEDCTIEDLDLGSARVSRMSVKGCRIDTLTVHGATLADVDLRGATLSVIAGLTGLKGTTVGPEQLYDLAPLLAAHLGIEIA
jgi:uncharacterized protein YjbI with pentapeptide repeats